MKSIDLYSIWIKPLPIFSIFETSSSNEGFILEYRFLSLSPPLRLTLDLMASLFRFSSVLI